MPSGALVDHNPNEVWFKNDMPGECWTVNEIDSLITQVAFEKRRLPDLCIPGRGEAAINNQRRRLKEAGRLEGVFTGRTLKPWTICELKTLRNFTQGHGFSAAFISQLQLVEGRSKDSISGMMQRHGLGNEIFRSRSKCARRLTKSQQEELITFLQGEGRLIPSTCCKTLGYSPKDGEWLSSPPRNSTVLAAGPLVRRPSAAAGGPRQEVRAANA